MNNPNPITLEPGMIVVIDGVEITYEEIKANKIDVHILRKHKGDA